MSDHERDGTDIRYALADDLDRMGLWPDKVCVSCDAVYTPELAGRRCECGGLLMIMAVEDERYEHRPNDWHIDTP